MKKRVKKKGWLILILIVILITVFFIYVSYKENILFSPQDIIPNNAACVWPPVNTSVEIRNMDTGYIGWANNNELANITYLPGGSGVRNNYVEERLLCYNNVWHASINKWTYFPMVVGHSLGEDVAEWKSVPDGGWERKWVKNPAVTVTKLDTPAVNGKIVNLVDMRASTDVCNGIVNFTCITNDSTQGVDAIVTFPYSQINNRWAFINSRKVGNNWEYDYSFDVSKSLNGNYQATCLLDNARSDSDLSRVSPYPANYIITKDINANGCVVPIKTNRSYGYADGKTWYVRPLIYSGVQDSKGNPLPIEGVYGNQNGSNYDNAWNGLKSVVWGENGVKAGDTLYICGQHIYKTNKKSYISEQANIVIGASGTKEREITIRMDCPYDQGSVWGTFRDDSINTGPAKWTGPDSNGVYWTKDLPYGAVVEFNGSDYKWLDKMDKPTWQGHNGAYYSTSRVNENWLTDKTYVKSSDGKNPYGKVYSPGFGYTFDLTDSSYINFYKCNLYGSVVRKNRLKDFPNGNMANHITFDSCNIKYGLDYGALFLLYK